MKGRCAAGAVVALALCPASALAQRTATFWYTGTEQTFTVPEGSRSVHVRAIGAPGGGLPPTRDQVAAPPGYPTTSLQPGRGAIVEGSVSVTPGQVLYVLVGTSGGLSEGGFNGGGAGGSRHGWGAWGGGGASDLRTLPADQGTASLESRLVVAAGGGGSAGIAAGGGDAEMVGMCCGAQAVGPPSAQPGTETHGGEGGKHDGAGGTCAVAAEGCGMSGGFGSGGDGGVFVFDNWPWSGAGGGGGWYGGGGGAGHTTNIGGGAGGSSKRPPGGTAGLAERDTPPRVSITPYRTPRTGCSDGSDNDADGIADHPDDPGCAGPGDEDEWNPDTFPPSAMLLADRTQKLGRPVVVKVSCLAKAEDCIVTATGTLTTGTSARAYKLARANRLVVRRGEKLTLRLGVPRRTRAAAAQALRRRSRIHATVDVRVTDEIGNARQLSRRIRLVR